MDDRIVDQARVIVNHSTEVRPADRVVIEAGPAAEPLVVALHELLGRRGATPMTVTRNPSFERAYLRNADPEAFELGEHLLAAVEETDVYISVRGTANPFETADVPADVLTAYGRVQRPIVDERLDTRWVATQFPAPAGAQAAEMSTEAYRSFVHRAVTKDWAAQRSFQERLVEILAGGDTVRLVSGDRTDLTLGIEGMIPVNDDGTHNLPGGEVFTAPIPDSVEGTVEFDMPVITRGRRITGAYLEFEGGEVVHIGARENGDVLRSVVETDPGAGRLGEIGFGMNRDIDRFTNNMLFDEKMGDTVHLALGRAYEDTVPKGGRANESAVHLDMIVDMSEASRIEVDGEVIQRDGTFRFETPADEATP